MPGFSHDMYVWLVCGGRVLTGVTGFWTKIRHLPGIMNSLAVCALYMRGEHTYHTSLMPSLPLLLCL